MKRLATRRIDRLSEEDWRVCFLPSPLLRQMHFRPPLSLPLSLSLSTIWQDDAAQKPSSGSAARRPARCMERRRRPCSRAVRGYRHYTMQKSDRLLSRLIDAVDACYTPSPLFGTNLVSISLCDPALRRGALPAAAWREFHICVMHACSAATKRKGRSIRYFLL